jgi:Zn-dependent peptidase ImmA (M78 family)
MSRVVRRRTRDDLEELAWRTRATLGLAPGDYVPVANLIENVLPDVIEGFEVRVAERGSLGAAEAITHQSKPIITFEERAYDGLYRDKPRARMTAIHELAHLIMHSGQYAYAFARRYDPLIDPERQADVFAAAFLMPEVMFRRVSTIEEAMKKFGVSREAATCRARALRLWRLIAAKPVISSSKEKGSSKRRTP